MNLLFPTKVNGRVGAATVEDFQPLRKRERVTPDLRYQGESWFRFRNTFVQDLTVGQGWTCSFDSSTGKVYMVRVENNTEIPPRFCVKTANKKQVTNRFKAEILADALGNAVAEKNFTLRAIEEQPIQGVTLFEIVSLDADVEIEEEEVEETPVEEEVTIAPATFDKTEPILTDDPKSVEEAKQLNPFESSEFAQSNELMEESLM